MRELWRKQRIQCLFWLRLLLLIQSAGHSVSQDLPTSSLGKGGWGGGGGGADAGAGGTETF